MGLRNGRLHLLEGLVLDLVLLLQLEVESRHFVVVPGALLQVPLLQTPVKLLQFGVRLLSGLLDFSCPCLRFQEAIQDLLDPLRIVAGRWDVEEVHLLGGLLAHLWLALRPHHLVRGDLLAMFLSDVFLWPIHIFVHKIYVCIYIYI